MGQVVHAGLDALDGADQVLEQVDVVKGLLDSDAGAGAAGHAPGVHPVIVGRAEPLHVGVGVVDLAETTFLNGLPHGLNRLADAALQDHADLDAGRGAGGGHAVHLAQGHGGGFLDQDVLAGAGAGQHGVGVEVVGGQDVDDLDGGVGEHLIEVGVGGAGELAREFGEALGIDVGGGYQLGAV